MESGRAIYGLKDDQKHIRERQVQSYTQDSGRAGNDPPAIDRMERNTHGTATRDTKLCTYYRCNISRCNGGSA
jgi:hypothetical protein